MVWVYRLSTYSNHLHFGYAENANSYGDVMKNGYFIPRSNVIYESAVFFNWKIQAKDESDKIFIRSLHELAEYCSFDNKSEEIRLKLVIGIRDKELSEKLQLN